MPEPRPLPRELGDAFSVSSARALGVSERRLRHRGLGRPFRGIRTSRVPEPDPGDADDPFAQQRLARRTRAWEYLPRLRPGQFFSHETAAAIWGAPLPLAMEDGRPIDPHTLSVHVSVLGDGHLIRSSEVSAHRARPQTSRVTRVGEFPVASAETMWASLGSLPLIPLVALGDHLCRAWRPGYRRPNAGMRPITTIADLRRTIDAGRRVGIRRLRTAVELIREDSWSPRESAVRCHIVLSGLPEPTLNHDVFSDDGRFLGCVDLAYPDLKVAVEYHGVLHSSRYAADVERMAGLRAHGWIVIEVTATLLADPDALFARIRSALAEARSRMSSGR